MYDEYRNGLTRNSLDNMKVKLNALRTVKRNLLNADNLTPESRTKLFETYDEVKNLREKYFEISRNHRNVIKSTLRTWAMLKIIRQNTKYSVTSIKLSIRKEKSDYEQDQKQRGRDMKEVCSEIADELEFEYKFKLETYKDDLQHWKNQIHDDEVAQEDLPRKPKKPHSPRVDKDAIYDELSQVFEECFKPPGEPDVHFGITYEERKADAEIPAREVQRKNSINSTRFFLRILCNKIEVCKSKSFTLNDSFACFFNQCFSLQGPTLAHISIEIYEQANVLTKRKVGEVDIVLPKNSSISLDNAKIIETQFGNEEIVHYKHEGVGSGVNLQDIIRSYNTDCYSSDEVLCTRGIVSYTCGWSCRATENTISIGKLEGFDHVKHILKKDGSVDVQKLSQWVSENKPDPKDPKNAVLFDYLQKYGDKNSIQKKSEFR